MSASLRITFYFRKRVEDLILKHPPYLRMYIVSLINWKNKNVSKPRIFNTFELRILKELYETLATKSCSISTQTFRPRPRLLPYQNKHVYFPSKSQSSTIFSPSLSLQGFKINVSTSEQPKKEDRF